MQVLWSTDPLRSTYQWSLAGPELDNTLHQCVKDAFGTPTWLGSGAA